MRLLAVPRPTASALHSRAAHIFPYQNGQQSMDDILLETLPMLPERLYKIRCAGRGAKGRALGAARA
jgi:hypothetical protein